MRDLTALRARLRQAGLKPASSLPPPVRKQPAIPIDWPGREVVTPAGAFMLAEYNYAADWRHGGKALAKFLETSPLPNFPDVPADATPADMIFMDTETTGLAGGAGTLAFLVGTGSYTAEGFVLRQYFLPDPSGEAAMLEASLSEMESHKALVTFNGRAFDVPILQARAALRLRRLDALTGIAQFDLLIHSRRLWRSRLESCALRTLEAEVLDVRRSSDDVPSGLIPYLYREYLQTNDPNLMAGVLYHNAQDILSMAVLAAEVADRYRRAPDEFEDPLDALAMGFIYRGLGKMTLAEQSLRAALRAELAGEDRVRALEGLANILKPAADTTTRPGCGKPGTPPRPMIRCPASNWPSFMNGESATWIRRCNGRNLRSRRPNGSRPPAAGANWSGRWRTACSAWRKNKRARPGKSGRARNISFLTSPLATLGDMLSPPPPRKFTWASAPSPRFARGPASPPSP